MYIPAKNSNYRGNPSKNIIAVVHFLAFYLPLVLLGLFWVLRNNTALISSWVDGCVKPMAKFLATLTDPIPFALGEGALILLAIFVVVWVGFRVRNCVRKRHPLFQLFHLKVLVAVVLWVLVWLFWFWNVLYYVPSFAERTGLDIDPYSVDELYDTTLTYAKEAAKLSTRVPRDDTLNFDVEQSQYFGSATTLYLPLEAEFPFLAMGETSTKPLVLSRFQSHFGFSGMYSPYTGEANVNIDTPSVLHPVTIAHEMAHQRSIAPEQEANFLAIIACSKSDDVIFRYSGALYGLMQLSSALSSVSPDLWDTIVAEHFTPEIFIDWNYTVAYWAQFESPVKDASHQVYDEFLKSNEQELGMKSYGACVDLLVAYHQQSLT
ncbi:MAG: DUF3810 domain-containing protein [Eubacteriales bacterium]